MIDARKTDVFGAWFDGLRDRAARGPIQARIDRLALGNPGNHRVLTGGFGEIKIDLGPGCRVYYLQRGEVLLVLLCGGDKASQCAEIKVATAMANQLDQSHDAQDHVTPRQALNI